MMERCDSMAALTGHEQPFDYISTESDSEGTCSGYDSSSDFMLDEHENHQLSDLKNPEILSIKDEKREKMSFQSTDALSSHLKYIMSMPELCDVRFLVGEDKVPIYGLKAIMATRSRTFYHLIIKHQRKQEMELATKRKKKRTSPQHLTIDVRKYESDVFRKIIQFVHCGKVDVSVDNVAGLLCGASQFGLVDLRGACWDFIERCLHRDCIHQILRSARRYSQHKITTRLLHKVNQHLADQRVRNRQRRIDTVV